MERLTQYARYGWQFSGLPTLALDLDMREKNVYAKAAERLAQYESTGLSPDEIPHWIPVSEPPKKEQWCHIAVKTKNGYRVENDLFAVETADHFGHEHGFCKRDVAYWMSYPQPPKEEN